MSENGVGRYSDSVLEKQWCSNVARVHFSKVILDALRVHNDNSFLSEAGSKELKLSFVYALDSYITT